MMPEYTLIPTPCSVLAKTPRKPKGKQKKDILRHPSHTPNKMHIPSPSQSLNLSNANTILSPHKVPSSPMTSDKQQLSHYLSVLIEKSAKDPKLQERVVAIFNATIAFKFSRLVRTAPSASGNPSDKSNTDVVTASREAFYQEHGGRDAFHKARLVTGRYIYIARTIDPTLLVYMLNGAFALKYTKHHPPPKESTNQDFFQ